MSVRITGVKFDSKLAVRLLDLELGGGGRNAKGVVVGGFYDHVCVYEEREVGCESAGSYGVLGALRLHNRLLKFPAPHASATWRRHYAYVTPWRSTIHFRRSRNRRACCMVCESTYELSRLSRILSHVTIVAAIFSFVDMLDREAQIHRALSESGYNSRCQVKHVRKSQYHLSPPMHHTPCLNHLMILASSHVLLVHPRVSYGSAFGTNARKSCSRASRSRIESLNWTTRSSDKKSVARVQA